MYGEESEVAKVALFGFILGDTEEERMEAFNMILAEVGVPAKLVKDCDKYLWCDCTNHSERLAEEVFDEVANLFSNQTVLDYMTQERIPSLLDAYDTAIHNIKRRNETLRWIVECDEQCAN